MDLDGHDMAARGLRRYLALVAEAVGVGAEAGYAQLEPPIDAYLALDHRLRAFPTRDAALLWDERHGWALAIETHGGADLIVLGYLGMDILPAPDEVAGYVKRAVAGAGAGRPDPPYFRASNAADGLPTRLAGYAEPVEWLAMASAIG